MFKLPLLLLFAAFRYLSSEESLPRYMRGINWQTVEKYRLEDLRLSDNIIPVHYSINLSVNVRGRNDAIRSDFNGTLIISLIAKSATDKIEIHSRDLAIDKVNIFGGDVMEPDVAVTRMSTNSDRETLTFHLNRRLALDERIELEINYRGIARMDEYGLYENWTPNFNDSQQNFVLASKNFPVGARRWFPCLDEPNKQATFLLTVSHPQGLNAFSNSEKRETVQLNDGAREVVPPSLHFAHSLALSVDERVCKMKRRRRVTAYFKMTKRIPTNKLALAIVDFSRVGITASSMVALYRSENHPELSGSMRENDLIVAIEKNIILLDGTKTITVHPGLITIGRDAQSQEYSEITRRIGEIDFDLDRMYIGKNDAAAHKYSQIISGKGASNLTKIAWQLFDMVDRMCPDARKVFQSFISNKDDRLAKINDFLGKMSGKCDVSVIEFFTDFIDQPGKAFLIVSRSPDSVIVKQTRYHSSYFDDQIRDTRTRFTLPIFYTIDGNPSMKLFPKNASSITVHVAENATFLIDNRYNHVYNVYYDFMMPVLRNWDEEKFTMTLPEEEREKRPLRSHAVKSLLSALEIGFITYETAIEQVAYYLEKRIFSNWEVRIFTANFLEYINNHMENPQIANKTYECRRHPQFIESTTWNGLFNNASRYFEDVTSRPFDMSLFCMDEWRNTSTYLAFLEENFIGDAVSIVRAASLDYVRQKGGSARSWKEFHRFFFKNVHNATTPMWDRLTSVALVLKPFGVKSKCKVDWFYPRADWQNDYLEVLRKFISKHPKRAASMAVEIEMRLEREFIREERKKFFGLSEQKVLETAKKLWKLLPEDE